MKKITILLSMLLLTFSGLYAQTVFEFETATDNGDNVTETIDGITVTVTGGTAGLQLLSAGGYGGSTGNVLYQPTNVSSLTFTFSEAVDINSILAMEGNGLARDYTFTPTGGSNSPVMASIPINGGISVDLNWTEVTSFTVTTSSGGGSAFTFDALSVSPNTYVAPTVFDWETVTFQFFSGSGYHAFETIDGITVEVDGNPYGNPNNNGLYVETLYGTTYGEYGGVTGQAIVRQAYDTAPVTFTFSEPVDVHSILLLEWTVQHDVDFTFSTTDGTNASHMVTTAANTGIASESPVNLNWVGVTSFTVTPSAPSYVTGSNAGKASPMFDHLSVSPSTGLSVSEVNTFQTAKVYPNPVDNILNIKNVSDLKSITVYNSLGQLVLQSKKKQLDVSHLSKGIYFLQIHSGQGIETKRIIKK